MFRNTHQYFLECATENISDGRLKCNYFPMLMKKSPKFFIYFLIRLKKKYLKKR